MVTTSGPGADTTSHYSVSADGGTGRLIASNGSMTIAGLSVGSHTVTLAGTPSNCMVDQNARTVTISAGTTATVPFAVTCVTLTGYLRINAVTTGADLPNGYAIILDYRTAQPLGANSAVVVPNLAVGGHSVALSGVPGNCTLAGTNPANATVVSSDTARITFSISCVAVGTLRVTAVTTGVDPDTNGYTVFVDANQRVAVASNGAVTVSPVTSGTHNVSLGDVSSNCGVTGSNPRSVVIPVHDTARVTFQVSCVKSPQIAFASGDANNMQIFLTNVAGTSLVPLTNGPLALNAGPAWSADGSKIAFHTNRDGNFEIYVMNADGTGAVNLTHSAGVDSGAAWSPDGSKIAFYSNRDGTDGLYVMHPDGSGVSKVITGIGGFHPAWSPDGTKLAFECHIDIGNRDICVINSNGTGVARLTRDAAVDFEPAWKPDGSKILFVTGRFASTLELALMNPDGTGVTPLFSDVSAEVVDDPAWSPDGTKIAFHELRSDCSDEGCYTDDYILVANADGTGAMGIPLAYGRQPMWRP
jgi:Tol biopolymer transport system component